VNLIPVRGNQPAHAFSPAQALIGFPETTISAVRGASDGELGSMAS